MAEYYLISQLPSLDGISENTPLPIAQERFFELCNRFLDKKSQGIMKKLTISPSRYCESTGSALVDAWNESEKNLRYALGKVRAVKMKKQFDEEGRILPVEYVKAAGTAAEMENPMEAEKYLSAFRLGMLEALRPMDSFSQDYIFYYGLKLMLLLRIRQFDKHSGEEVYRNIYNSILGGDKLEAMQ